MNALFVINKYLFVYQFYSILIGNVDTYKLEVFLVDLEVTDGNVRVSYGNGILFQCSIDGFI
jgi:hypothetical protein